MFGVTEPEHNLFEICKQLVLLEAHLFDESKRCPDCITKHFLSVIGYADELPTLDSTGEISRAIANVSPYCRSMFSCWSGGDDPVAIATGLRTVRKQLQPIIVECCKSRGVAFAYESEANHPELDPMCVRGCA